MNLFPAMATVTGSCVSATICCTTLVDRSSSDLKIFESIVVEVKNSPRVLIPNILRRRNNSEGGLWNMSVLITKLLN